MIQELLQRDSESVHLCRPQGGPTKIRVTYLVGSLRDAGTERQVLELARRLDRAAFDPALILMEDAGTERAREAVERYFVLGIPQGGNSRWTKRGLSLANAIRRARAQLVEWHSDVLHAFLPGPSIIGAVAARLAGVPVCIGSRRSLVSFYRPRRGMAAWADRAAFHLADVNLGNSRAVSAEMTGRGGCPAQKCQTVYNGVDTERFRPDLPQSWRSLMGWSRQQVIFGLVANFRDCKRHADFVEAAALVLQRHPAARFVMVGADSGSRAAVVQQILRLGLQEQIRILDCDPSPEKIFAALDVYVCTSESEGFSNVLLEAMACGKPVIATDVGGNSEAVQDGETGLLVPVRSPHAVAQAAEKLLEDAVLRVTMGARGRQRVQDCFSLERMVGEHEELYQRLVSEREKVCRHPGK